MGAAICKGIFGIAGNTLVGFQAESEMRRSMSLSCLSVEYKAAA